MATEPIDLSSMQVEMDLAQRPPALPPMQEPPPGLEMVEEIAESAGGGGHVGPPVLETMYPGISNGSVLLAPPGFTICESFFDSGVFTCFNPEVVFGTEVLILPNGSFSMGDEVWCNVTVEDEKIKTAELVTSKDYRATVSVHVADIMPDGVKQYHVGAIIVSSNTNSPGSLPELPELDPPVSVIVDIQYDTYSHQIQVKRAKLSGYIKITDIDEDWSMITGGQAVQHTSDS
jgi:hypothetical protein